MNYLKGVLFSLVFFAIITIISLWSSYVFRFAPLILIVSVAVTYFLTKQFKLELFQISSSAIYLSLAIAFLVAHPFLFVTPFVDASADPAAHISALAITDSIPETYAPFSYLEYRYQIGFPLLAKMFIDLLPFVSSNFIVWLLGVIFTFLSAILIYTISREFFDDEKAGLIALALFFGSKIIFQNMFWGQYTFILASVFFLATLLTFQKKNKLAYLFFPIIFIAHPGVGFYALIFFGLWTLIYKNYSESLKLFLSGLIALPSFFITYIHFLSNFGNEGIPLTISSLIDNSLIFTLWIGGLIFVLGILGLAFIIYKKDFSKLNLLLISSFIVSGLISILLSASGKILGGRVVELAMFSGLFLSVYFVLKLVNSKQKLFIPAFFLILILSFGLFLTSSQLSHLKSGSKITQGEIEFAYAFKEFDSDYEKTFFLVENHAKIAEVSQKIPYDVMSDFYLSYDPRIAGNDSYFSELEQIHENAEKARLDECLDCIQNAEFRYLVAKNDYFSNSLGLKKVFEHGSYSVFSR